MVVVAGLQLALLLIVLYRRDQTIEALIRQNDRLCQRIQAPEQAVLEHSISETQEHAPVPVFPDDDEAFWESKDDMAERLMRAESNA